MASGKPPSVTVLWLITGRIAGHTILQPPLRFRFSDGVAESVAARLIEDAPFMRLDGGRSEGYKLALPIVREEGKGLVGYIAERP
jgi:hypothetical protein